MRCVEGEKEGAWKLAIDREVVHVDCVWVGLRPTIDAKIVANDRMWESALYCGYAISTVTSFLLGRRAVICLRIPFISESS